MVAIHGGFVRPAVILTLRSEHLLQAQKDPKTTSGGSFWIKTMHLPCKWLRHDLDAEY